MPKTSENIVEISALAPLHFGDGRPFAASNGDETHARSLPLPLPNTQAGFIRTQIARARGVNLDDHSTLQDLHGVPVYGPVLYRNGMAVLPAPRDAAIAQDKNDVLPLLPKRHAAGGTNTPSGMLPLVSSLRTKAATDCTYWKEPAYTKWLLGEKVSGPCISPPPQETRVHVRIDPNTGAAAPGLLYSAAYQYFEGFEGVEKGGGRGKFYHWSIRARVGLPSGSSPAPLGYFGGERRPARVKVLGNLSEYWYNAPAEIKDAFASLGDRLVRMVLITPALFDGGWRPGWVEKSGSGEAHLPRGLSKVRLKLVAAAVGRREPVSGWNMREQRPRPVRWAAPAGSVYFFEVLEGDPAVLLESWMRPVSDRVQDRRDGFGLAVWGVSEYAE